MSKKTSNTNLVEATLENCSLFGNADAVTLYYKEEPTKEEVVADLKALYGKLDLSVDTTDRLFTFKESPTKASQKASLKRFQCYPSG